MPRSYFKLILIFLLILLSVGCSTFVRYKQIKPLEIKKGEKYKIPSFKEFKLGEKLVYSVYWMGIPVGEAEIYLKDIVELKQTKAFHAIASIHSNKWLSLIYKVDDRIETFIDVNKLIPLKYRRFRHEGRYVSEAELDYDFQENKVYFHSFTDSSRKIIDILPDRQDKLSCFYYFRKQELSFPGSISLYVNDDEKNWKINIKILSLGKLNIPNVGVYDVFKTHLVPSCKDTVFKKGKAWIWFSADKERIPVMAQVKVFLPIVGRLIIVLKEIRIE